MELTGGRKPTLELFLVVLAVFASLLVAVIVVWLIQRRAQRGK